MTAHERLARALRDAADAVEELAAGKPKRRRHRGPVKVEHAPVDEATERKVVARLHRAGLVNVR